MSESAKDILADLIAFPTVSCDSNLAMIGYLADRLSSVGARIDMQLDESGAKANLFATLGPEGDGGIVLSGHTDVVPVEGQDWTSDPFVMVERDGHVFGRGTCDMKGFIAACLALAPDFASRRLTRPVHFAFTYDEETGCIGGQALVAHLEEAGLRPSVAIVGEPTSMRVIDGHKGVCEYTTEFNGLAGHGSAPDAGVNAAEYAVRYASRLLELREELKTRAPAESRFEPPWSTINIGRISGGYAHNVIPEHCSLEWDLRPVHRDDVAHVKQTMDAHVGDRLLPQMRAVWSGASIETRVVGEVHGLIPATENEARDIVFALTGANGTDLVAFGTEAGLFQKLGLSVVVCGPGSIEQAHKADEFLALDQLDACTAMLRGLADRCSTTGDAA